MNRAGFKIIFIVMITTHLSIAHAGGSVEHSTRALEMSLEALGHSMIASLKLVSGATAVPLISAGEIGKVSGEIGEDLWEEANTPISDAFPISDEVVTAGPDPEQQMEKE